MVQMKSVMDPEEKKRIANEKRLKAVKEWKRNLTVQTVKPCNLQEDPEAVPVNTRENKMKLFESDDEEGKYEDCFKTRPQFDGPHGQELLEMSSNLSGRFKLDERFKEEDLPKPVTEDNQEKERNMKILQSILGYEVISKPVDKSAKKRAIRFDPEDEKAAKCIRECEIITEKPKKQKCKKRSEDDKVESEIPVSTERYIEVSSNLKEILNTSTPFSFSQRFNEEVEEEAFIPVTKKVNPDYKIEEEIKIGDLRSKDEDKKYERSQEFDSTYKDKKYERSQEFESTYKDKKYERSQEFGARYFASKNETPKMKNESFFIKSGDPRLKEGVEFFKRPKPLEEIREEWLKKKDYVLELFKKRKRANLRSHSTKVKSVQLKNALRRKQNFQYL